MSLHDILQARIANQVQMVIDAAERLGRNANLVATVAKSEGSFTTPCTYIAVDSSELIARIAQLSELQVLQAALNPPKLSTVAAMNSGGPAPCGHVGSTCGCPSAESL